jgi:hypothetical protein
MSSMMLFVDLKSSNELTKNVREKLETALRTVVLTRSYLLPIWDLKVDAIPESSFYDFQAQIYYVSDEPEIDGVESYLDVRLLFDMLLKGPANPRGVITDYYLGAACDAPDPCKGFQRGDAPFEPAIELPQPTLADL